MNNWIQSEKGKNILTIIIVILVGLASFGLGRLSKGSSSAGIKIEYPNGSQNQSANVISATETALIPTQSHTSAGLPAQAGKSFFASNRGSKYYSLGCSGGKTIKQENRIYFVSAAEAEKAGYELSSSCSK